MDALHAGQFQPPRMLRDPHVQSLLSSSHWRRRRGAQRFGAMARGAEEMLLDGGDGARLQGFLSDPTGPGNGALAVLLHGWEGSAESGYLLHTAAELLGAGFRVLRLNFRDHGDTHHLNEEIFHSCRIDELVHAIGDANARLRPDALLVAGFSLGGNHALRVALRGPAAGVPVTHAAAVCPVIDPAAGMAALETNPLPYHWYFHRKWTRSLRRKRELFPERNAISEDALRGRIRDITAWLVEHYTDFPDVQAYYDGYSIAGARLAALEVPVSILTAADDPVIPVASFHELQLPPAARLEISRHGGHCGFIEGLHLGGFGERWVADRLGRALAAGGGAAGQATIAGSVTA